MERVAGAALRFVEAINTRNVENVVALMTRTHSFTDALGNVFRGRRTLHAAWSAYFTLVPDYHIDVEHAIVRADTAALFGRASGTFAPDGVLRPQSRWEIPWAGLAVVSRGTELISEWRIYCDNEPIRRLIQDAGYAEVRPGAPPP